MIVRCPSCYAELECPDSASNSPIYCTSCTFRFLPAVFGKFTVCCPQCAHLARCPDEHVGKNVKCRTCGTSFVAEEQEIPSPPAIVDVGPSIGSKVWDGTKAVGRFLKPAAPVFIALALAGGVALAVYAFPREASFVGDRSMDAIGRLICIFPCVCCVGTPLINVLLLLWVGRDARCRGMDSGSWTIVILLTGLFGWLIYMSSRPSGNLTSCPNCGNSCLEAMVRCPHCQDKIR